MSDKSCPLELGDWRQTKIEFGEENAWAIRAAKGGVTPTLPEAREAAKALGIVSIKESSIKQDITTNQVLDTNPVNTNKTKYDNYTAEDIDEVIKAAPLISKEVIIDFIMPTYATQAERLDAARASNEGSIKAQKDAKQYEKDAKGKFNQLTAVQRNKKYVEKINRVLRDKLKEIGLLIGDLQVGDEGNGIYDPKAAKAVADGFVDVIRIAKGAAGENALPHEVSHLIIDGLEAQNPDLYARLKKVLEDNPEYLREVFESQEAGLYDKYIENYGKDQKKMVKEAMGMLLEKHLFQAAPIALNTPYKSLLSRFITWLRNFLAKGDYQGLKKDILEADKEYNTLALSILKGTHDIKFDFANSRNKDRLNSLVSSLDTKAKVYQKIYETEIKRGSILENKRSLTKVETASLSKHRDLINHLEAFKGAGDINKSIVYFMQQASSDMADLYKEIESITLDDKTIPNLQDIAKTLRSMKTYLTAYKPIIQDITTYTLTDAYKTSGVNMDDELRLMNSLLNSFQAQYDTISKPVYSEFIYNFMGNSEGQSIKGVVHDRAYLDKLVETADEDISFFDKWLRSASHSTDDMIRLFERPVKNAKHDARMEEIPIIHTLQALQLKLEEAGFKDSSFVYERNDKGKLTGNLISKLDYKKWRAQQQAERDRLEALHPQDLVTGLYPKAFWDGMNAWNTAHSEKDVNTGKFVAPKADQYPGKEYSKLAPAQQKFYDGIFKIKQDMDKKLPPEKVKAMLAPQTRKDAIEVLSQNRNWKGIKDYFAAGWTQHESDDSFGQAAVDFEGKELSSLPIYYTNLMENTDNLSTDIVSSMVKYVDMAVNYDHMSKVLDLMELGRDVLSNRLIPQTKGNRPLMEKINSAGRVVENRISKRDEANNFMERIGTIMDISVYGRIEKDEGTWGKTNISKAKTANNINQLTVSHTYAVNLLAGVNNVAMGVAMMNIEAAAKQYFKPKDLVWADKAYSREVLPMLGQIGQRQKTNKMDLMFEYFNVMQNKEKAIRGIEMNKRGLLRLFKGSNMFFLANCGEHWMQGRTFMALAAGTKLKQNGKEINLWDAYEVVKNTDGSVGIQLKAGVTKTDGSAFTSEDVGKLSRKSGGINQQLHGIYNTEDMNAFQQLAIGRMAMMFRKWMVSAWDRRYQGEIYNYDIDMATEGYYRSAGRFMKGLFTELDGSRFNLAANWKNLNDMQKSNVKRALTEVGMFLGLGLAILALGSAGWDDDDEWYKGFIYYQNRRLFTELGALAPTPYIFNAGFKLLGSPAAGIDFVQNFVDLLKIWDLGSTMESGRHKGMNRYLHHATMVAPYYAPIDRAIDIHTSNQYAKR